MGAPVKLERESTGEFIDPATEDMQRNVRYELTKFESATNDVKYQVLTLAAGAVGTPEVGHACKGLKVWTALSDCYIGDVGGQPVLLIASTWNPIPINNTSLLRFLSVAGGAVYLISSN